MNVAETLGKMEQSNSQSSRPAKYVALTDPLYDYIARHRSRVVDPLLDALRAETESLGDVARMLISPEQGNFLTLLTKLLDVRTAVEVGTFTGYSSICLARGLADGGRLHCFDVNAEWASIARRYWKQDGLASRVELQLGDAKQVLLDWEPRAPMTTHQFATRARTPILYWPRQALGSIKSARWRACSPPSEPARCWTASCRRPGTRKCSVPPASRDGSGPST